MSNPFDLLLFGRRKIAAAAGSSPTQQSLTKTRLRIIRQVFNSRRLVYQNRVESNRQNFVLSTIENEHKRAQAIQRVQRNAILTDLKQKRSIAGSGFAALPSYEPIDLTEPKDFYRFGLRVQSAGPHTRSSTTEVYPDLIRSNQKNKELRAKSALVLPQSYTTRFHTNNHRDLESNDDDDDDILISASRITSSKSLNNRLTSTVFNTGFSQNPTEVPTNNTNAVPSSIVSSNHRITWPVRLKVFALQDEEEARQQVSAWRAEQRAIKRKESLNPHLDLAIERQYNESLRRQKEIEAFATPDLIEEHFIHDPIFAKRYRQLALAVRSGKAPNYDPKDREIHTIMTKSKIERARMALITAKQSKAKTFYRNQQRINDAILSERIESFLQNLAKFNEEQKLRN